MPRIGVTTGLDPRGGLRPGRATHYLDAAYARAVAEAGGEPLALLPGPAPEALLDGVSGLLLPGGDDFPPERAYPPTVRFTPAPPEQIAFDAALLDAALARELPVLGICYGMQLLALRRGAALHFDLAHDRPDAGEHRLVDPAARHEVTLAPGSRLAALFGAARLDVNSRHHQAAASPGRGLVASARADDGVIEGIEDPGARFVLGVQWHPEDLDRAHRRALFGALVAACAAARPGG